MKIFNSIIASITYRSDSFLLHYHGPDYIAAIQDYDNALRAKVKWTEEEGTFYDAREMLYEAMQNRGINIWD